MARLYSNENFPLLMVQELRRLGHDVLTVQEAGNADRAIPDDAVLAFAMAEGVSKKCRHCLQNSFARTEKTRHLLETQRIVKGKSQ